MLKFAAKVKYAIHIDPIQFGLTELDKARFVHPDLLMEYFTPFSNSLKADPVGIINEDQGRKSGHFLKSNYLEVEVEEKSLNKFCEIVYRKEYKEVEPTYEYSFSEIFKAWEEAGFPLKWDVK